MGIKVSFLVPNCNAGGTERVCQRLANYLVSIGEGVLVISMADQSFPYPLHCDYATLDGMLPDGKLNRWRHRRRSLLRVLRNHGSNTIISMGEYPNLLVASLPCYYKRINRYTNSTASLLGVKGRIMRLALRLAYMRADLTIVPVLRLAQELGLPDKHEKIKVLPNPIDLAEIADWGARRPEIDLTVLQEGAPFFVHIGQLVEQKDHDFLLNAYARYRAEGGNGQLVIIGKGEREKYIKSLIRKLDLSEVVHMLGWQENPVSIMSRAIAMLMTSRWEGTPNVMIEAMAVGCPVISTDCPTGPREILQSGEAGRLVSLDNQSVFVAEMKRMEKDIVWRDTWCSRAKCRAQDYSIIKIGNELCQLLSKSPGSKG